MNVEISDEEMATRKANFVPSPPKHTRGVLARYVMTVKSASEGAVTGKPTKPYICPDLDALTMEMLLRRTVNILLSLLLFSRVFILHSYSNVLKNKDHFIPRISRMLATTFCAGKFEAGRCIPTFVVRNAWAKKVLASTASQTHRLLSIDCIISARRFTQISEWTKWSIMYTKFTKLMRRYWKEHSSYHPYIRICPAGVR